MGPAYRKLIRVEGHSTGNNVTFKDYCEDLQKQLEKGWIEYAEKVIRRMLPFSISIHSNNATYLGPRKLAEVGLEIPSNVEGIPIFPPIDLEQTSLAEVRNLLSKYFMTIWGKCSFMLLVTFVSKHIF